MPKKGRQEWRTISNLASFSSVYLCVLGASVVNFLTLYIGQGFFDLDVADTS